MKRQIAVCAVMGGLLAACGGSSTGFDIPEFEEFTDFDTASAAAIARVDDLEPTASTDIPTAGTGTFAGTIIINDTSGADIPATVFGGIEVVVDFADAGAISGEAGNLFDITGSRIGGTLSLDDASFGTQSGASGFQADLTGRLDDVGDEDGRAAFDYNIGLFQRFEGEGVAALTGLGGGTATEVGSETQQPVFVTVTAERR